MILQCSAVEGVLQVSDYCASAWLTLPQAAMNCHGLKGVATCHNPGYSTRSSIGFLDLDLPAALGEGSRAWKRGGLGAADSCSEQMESCLLVPS